MNGTLADSASTCVTLNPKTSVRRAPRLAEPTWATRGGECRPFQGISLSPFGERVGVRGAERGPASQSEPVQVAARVLPPAPLIRPLATFSPRRGEKDREGNALGSD